MATRIWKFLMKKYYHIQSEAMEIELIIYGRRKMEPHVTEMRM